MTLSQYVLKRNGVPMGDNKGLLLMLQRAFGAGSFANFWKYWNPIWSYYLSRFIFKPLKRVFPTALATILTFSISGLIHDLAVMVLKSKISFLLSYWFTLMGILVVAGELLKINYSKSPFWVRVIFNFILIGGSFTLVKYLIF